MKKFLIAPLMFMLLVSPILDAKNGGHGAPGGHSPGFGGNGGNGGDG